MRVTAERSVNERERYGGLVDGTLAVVKYSTIIIRGILMAFTRAFMGVFLFLYFGRREASRVVFVGRPKLRRASVRASFAIILEGDSAALSCQTNYSQL